MASELSGVVFEWLLANWAGCSEDPGALFPHLQQVNEADLAEELAQAIHKARALQEAS